MKITVTGNSCLFQMEEKDHLDLYSFYEAYCISKTKRKEYEIFVNKEKAKDNIPLNPKDIIEIRMKREKKVVPSDHPCFSVYEDDLILIAKKRAGQIIHDDLSNDALINDVAYSFMEHPFDVMPIHRLDKMTQGLVFFCKVPCFQAYFDKLLSEKKIYREYLAITEGRLNQCIDCNKKIGKDRHVNNKYRISESGKAAHTFFRPLAYYSNYTLIRCTLYTGRTHQIRVHLASLKHPIVNDMIYGHADKTFKEMGLYAYSLTFYSPLSYTILTVEDKNYKALDYFK